MFHFLKTECADWDRIGDVWNQEHLSQLPEQPCSMVAAAICTSTEFPYLRWSQSTTINRLPFAYSWPDFLFLVLPYSIRHHFTCDPKLVTWQLPWDKSIPCYYLLPFLPCWQEAWRASRLGTIRRSQNDSSHKITKRLSLQPPYMKELPIFALCQHQVPNISVTSFCLGFII